MTITAGDVLRVATRANTPGVGDFVNVYHFRVADMGTNTASEIMDELLAHVDLMHQEIATHHPTAMTYVDINVFNVTGNVPEGSFPWPVLTTGTGGAGDVLPSQVAAFVRATTGVSRNWAKKFYGPFLEAASGGQGTIGPTLMTDLGDLAARWIAPLITTGAGSVIPVVFHAATGTWKPLQEAVIRNVWATFRTRRIGRGA